jgi:hypothetical protein
MKLLLVIVACTSAFKFSDINPPGEDPYEIGRLETIHALVKDWPSHSAFEHDYDLPDELQPVRLSTYEYTQLFFGP